MYENHLDVPSRSGNPSLIGPVQFLRRAIIDENAKEATLPLYAGHNADGTTAWYILTETTNKEIADQDGLTFSAKLRYTDQGNAVRTATLDHAGAFIFASGAVDFSPVHSLVPGPEGAPFPLASFQPGSVGDATYTSHSAHHRRHLLGTTPHHSSPLRKLSNVRWPCTVSHSVLVLCCGRTRP